MATIDKFPEEYPSMVGTIEDKEDGILCPFKMANSNLYGYGAWNCDWSSDVCSSDLEAQRLASFIQDCILER